MSLKIVEIVDNCKVYNGMFIRLQDNGKNEWVIYIFPHKDAYHIATMKKVYDACPTCGYQRITIERESGYQVTGSPFVRNVLRGTGKKQITSCNHCDTVSIEQNGAIVPDRAFGALLQWN